MDEDEDKLIIDAEFFLALRKKGRIPTVEECIKNGADINIRFASNAYNTPLHIAVNKGDIEIVKILLRHGAKTDVINAAAKTPLELAKLFPNRIEIAEILANSNSENLALQVGNKNSLTDKKKPATIANPNSEYKKRLGTANVRGQLYETKLLTMIFLRTLRCEHITQFYLGTNLDEVGDMDDVCLRFKTVKDDYVIFLQAKHKHDVVKGVVKSADLWQVTNDFSLHKCYGSYKRTRETFAVDSTNDFFRGNYEHIKSYYVMYTTIKADIKDLRKKRPFGDDIVYNLIGTGKRNNVFQFTSEDENVKLLTNALLKERMKTLGKSLMQFKRDDKYDMMLLDEDIRNFHVVLAQKVLKVTEVNAEGHRTGTFREDFFTSNEEMLIVLRETLYAEVDLKNNRSIKEIELFIDNILDDPTANHISNLIGDVLVYDKHSKCLKLINERMELNSKYQSQLKSLKVPESTLNDALGIANRRKLRSYNLKLPKGFGNLDMTINEKKRDSRTTYLAGKISELIKTSADVDGNVIVRQGVFSPVKKQDDGVLDINGGIAGAIGNLLLSDGDNKYKFNMNAESLRINAKELQEKLLNEHEDLHKYRFCIDIDSFPRLSWDATEKEKEYAKDFLDKLYFYTVQEKEDKFEGIMTNELKEYECSGGFNKLESLIKANALYLKIHNEIQIWWMIEGTTYYLKRNMDIFDKIFRDMKNKGLLSFLNFIYLHDVHNIGIEFDSNAVDVLSVCKSDTHNAKMIVIHTEVHLLTCHKLVQYLGNAENYTFIDIDYVYRVSPHLLELIIVELSENNIPNVVIVCEDVTKYNINDLICSCRAEKIILVTSNYNQIEECVYVRDDRINLTDLTDSSQLKVLQTQFIYQGIEVMFAEVFDEGTKHLIDPKLLRKIINKEKIMLGQSLEPATYEEIRHYYVPRTLKYNESLFASSGNIDDYTSMSITTYDEYPESSNTFSPSTLIDHRDILKNRSETPPHDIVLLLDTSGMGKSTLLTHLSLETKKRYPKIWIQRINLIDHTKQFNEWQDKKIEMDDELALKFICEIIISKTSFSGNVLALDNNIDFEIVNEKLSIINSFIEDESLVSFELRTFLHCFKEGSTILLFDGFDEICPMYQREVTQLLKCLSCRTSIGKTIMDDRGNELPKLCVWITSRSYNDLSEMLEYEFGNSYTLQPFTYADVNLFLDKYMMRNLSLNTLSSEQLKNIDVFFDYMTRFSSNASFMENGLKMTNLSLHCVYVAALRYFNSETKRTHLSEDLLTYAKEWEMHVSEDFLHNYRGLNDAFTLSGVPLHIYLAVNYFHSQIKNTSTNLDDAKKLWDMDTNAFAFYEGFLETKLKTIWFEEKNCMDLSKPGVIKIYEKEKKEFQDNHKKLAFYALFQKCGFINRKALDEVTSILSTMEKGGEMTGLVERIVNGVPKFIHYTFAEYFAVENIIDVLKSGLWNEQRRMLHLILSGMLGWSMLGVLTIFDLKLTLDPDLLKSISCTRAHKFIFDVLVDQYNDINSSVYIFGDVMTPHLEKVSRFALKNLMDFLLNAMIDVVNEENLQNFIDLIDNGLFLDKLFNHNYYDQILNILECIRRIDKKKGKALLQTFLSRLDQVHTDFIF